MCIRDRLETNEFGNTGLQVTRLGYGAMELTECPEDLANDLLNLVLDSGINFIDTSIDYGDSEKLIGKFISHRRSEFFLASKCGCPVGFEKDHVFTKDNITNGINQSLKLLKTDYLDLVQLHSCSIDILKKGEVIDALVKARDSGKTRFIGYSGDNEDAVYAINTGVFDTLQTSFNLVEQHARSKLFEIAVANNMGIIAKRPIANGAWGTDVSPSAYADEYFRRAKLMIEVGEIPDATSDRIDLALGFVLAHSAVNTAIVGTRNLRHLQSNISMAESQNYLSDSAVGELVRRFNSLDDGWYQLE